MFVITVVSLIKKFSEFFNTKIPSAITWTMGD